MRNSIYLETDNKNGVASLQVEDFELSNNGSLYHDKLRTTTLTVTRSCLLRNGDDDASSSRSLYCTALLLRTAMGQM